MHARYVLCRRHTRFSIGKGRIPVRSAIFGYGHSTECIRLLCGHVPSARLFNDNTSSKIFQLWRFFGTNCFHDGRCLHSRSNCKYSLHHNCCWPRSIRLVWFLVRFYINEYLISAECLCLISNRHYLSAA